ncbi:MAG: cellulose biosynthesis protein BcsD [Pseudomonadota bacterium]
MSQGAAADTQALLDHHAREHCSAQWRAFLPLLFAELYRNASEADGDAFLRHLGSQLAQQLPLDDLATLEALERAINRRWAEVDWGFVRLSADQTGITLRHAACPTPMQPQGAAEPSSQRAMAAILEGCYAQWLKGQGGGERVPLQAVAESAGLPGCVTLRYGHASTQAAS